MVQEVLPKDAGGVIVRTVGEDATQETFKRELTTLINKWKRIKRKTNFTRAPALVHRETSLTRGIIRDLFSTKVEKLTVDSKQVYNEISEYLKGIAPELSERVHLYEEQNPLFDKADIETEIRDLFKRRCDLPSGGYIIIEPTEALVSIDINSGRYTGKKDPEKTILKTNIEAAREVARQIRLRDIGGIIVCDFIDMETRRQPRQGAPGAPHAPRPRPRAHQGVRGQRPRLDRDDAPASAAESPAEHDRAVSDLSGNRPRVHPGDDRPPHGAVSEAHGGGRAARQSDREAPSRCRDVRARARAGSGEKAREAGGLLGSSCGMILC